MIECSRDQVSHSPDLWLPIFHLTENRLSWISQDGNKELERCYLSYGLFAKLSTDE